MNGHSAAASPGRTVILPSPEALLLFRPATTDSPGVGCSTPALHTLDLPGLDDSASERWGKAQQPVCNSVNVPGALFFVLLPGHLFL